MCIEESFDTTFNIGYGSENVPWLRGLSECFARYCRYIGLHASEMKPRSGFAGKVFQKDSEVYQDALPLSALMGNPPNGYIPPVIL